MAALEDVVVGSVWVAKDPDLDDAVVTVEIVDAPIVIVLVDGTGKTRRTSPGILLRDYIPGGLEHTTMPMKTEQPWFPSGKLATALFAFIIVLVLFIVCAPIIGEL